MDVSADISYPAASPDETFAMLMDPDFRRAVCEATGALDYDVDVDEHEDGSARVSVTRTMPADVPDFMKAFIGDTVRIRQTETWDAPDASGGRAADLVVEISGQPAKMLGSIVLATDGVGSLERIRGDVKVSIPFFGAKVEPEFAKGIVAAAAEEQRTGSTWLART